MTENVSVRGESDNSARKEMVAAFTLFAGLAIAGGVAVAIGFHAVTALVLVAALMPIVTSVVAGKESTVVRALILAGVAYLTISVLWPRYVAFWLPGLPSINPPRMANILFLAVLVIALLKSVVVRAAISDSFDAFRVTWIIFGLYILSRLSSVLMSEDVAASVYAILNEYAVHAVCLVLGLVCGVFPDGKRLLVRVVLWVFVAVCAVAIIEVILGHNLFARFVDPANSYVQWAVSDKARGGGYRAQGTFGFPITLAEFIVVAFPLALAGVINGASKKVWVVLGVLLIIFLTAFGVYASGSRSGYVGILATGLFGFVVVSTRGVWQRRLKLGHLVVSVFVGLIMTVVVYFAIVYVFDLAFGSAADRVSNSMRATMYEQSLRVIWEAPLFGFGPGSAPFKVGIMTASGQLTVDSRVVSLMIDSGFSALFLYLALVSATLLVSFRNAALSSEREWAASTAIACSIFGFVPFFLILSLNDNQFILFFLIGIALAVEKAGSEN